MSNYESITIKDGKEVSSRINPAGEGSEFGKVVPIANPSQTSVDRISYADGQSSHDTARHTSVTIDNKGLEGLASARTPYDTAITDSRDINSKSSIVFAGKKMYVSTALQLGYLRMENGNYVEVTPAEMQAKANSQSAEATKNVRTIDFNDSEGKANLEAMSKAGNPQLVTTFAHTLIGNIVDGRECNSIVDTFSNQIGANPASVVEAFESMFSTQLEKAGEYIQERYNIDADAFINYISEEAPKHIRKMAMVSAFHNELSTLDQLVKHYKAGKKF